MASKVPTLKLNNGLTIPQFGLGTWNVSLYRFTYFCININTDFVSVVSIAEIFHSSVIINLLIMKSHWIDDCYVDQYVESD